MAGTYTTQTQHALHNDELCTKIEVHIENKRHQKSAHLLFGHRW